MQGSDAANILKQARYIASGLVKPLLYVGDGIIDELFGCRQLPVVKRKSEHCDEQDQSDHEDEQPFVSHQIKQFNHRPLVN
ncbi:hypothetical protein D3C84_1127550 [compost metagenome]